MKDQNFRDEKNKILQSIRHRETVEDKIKNRNHKIAQLKNSSTNLEEEKTKCFQRSQQILLKCTSLQKKMCTLYVEFEKKLNEKNETTIQKIEVSLEVSDAEEQLQSSTSELQEAKETLDNHIGEIKRKRDHARKLLEEAKATCGLDRDNLPNEYKKMFKQYVLN